MNQSLQNTLNSHVLQQPTYTLSYHTLLGWCKILRTQTSQQILLDEPCTDNFRVLVRRIMV
jgi:hypothetical protein